MNFPAFLFPAFDEALLSASPSTIAVIDRDGEVLWRNPAWWQFAIDNGADAASVSIPSYFDAIQGSFRDHYERAFANALATDTVFEQEYECSSPQRRRLFRLRAMPIGGAGLVLEHSLIAEAPLPADAEWPASAYEGPQGTIAQCGNCRRVHHLPSSAWHWVPALIENVHPKTSHVICPSCVGFYWGRKLGPRLRE